jgi:hypothetical protein
MTRTRLIAAAAAAALTAVAAGGVVTGFRSGSQQTPCDAAVTIVHEVRGKTPAAVGAAERDGAGYGSMLRGLITGDFEDVDGTPSPEVAGHLRRVADSLATAEAAGPAEFTTGETGRAMDELVTACEDES